MDMMLLPPLKRYTEVTKWVVIDSHGLLDNHPPQGSTCLPHQREMDLTWVNGLLVEKDWGHFR